MFIFKGLPRWLVVKDSPANAGNIRDENSISRWGSSPKEGHGNPLQHSCLENPTDREPGGLQSMGSRRGGHDVLTQQLLTLRVLCKHTHTL